MTETHKLEIEIAQLTLQQKIDDLEAQVVMLAEKESEAKRQLESEIRSKAELQQQIQKQVKEA